MHKFALCENVADAWGTLQELLESLFETNHSLLNLYFEGLLEEESVLWLIGEYLCYIEEVVVLQSRRGSGIGLIGYLEARRQACNFLKIPMRRNIPGIQFQ